MTFGIPFVVPFFNCFWFKEGSPRISGVQGANPGFDSGSRDVRLAPPAKQTPRLNGSRMSQALTNTSEAIEALEAVGGSRPCKRPGPPS